MIEQMNEIAELWFEWMWPMLWQVAVLVALVWIVDLLIRRRVWPQVRYALWLLVLVKLVLPPTLSTPTSLTSNIQPMALEAVNSQLSPAPNPIPVPVSEEPALVKLPTIATPTETLAQLAQLPKTVGPLGVSLSTESYIMSGWLLGATVLALLLTIRLTRLRKSHSNAAKPPQWFDELLDRAAKTLKLRRKPTVVLSHDVATPAVFGAIKPVLLIPADNLNRLSRKEIQHVLLHELAHIKRGDLIVHGLYMVLQVIYWFNPLLWFVRRQLQHLRELCCDATVAAILREQTSGYRETIIETARRMLTKPVGPGMGLLGLFEDSSRLRVRLKWLERKTWKYKYLRTILVFAVVALMCACVLPMANGKSLQDQGVLIRIHSDGKDKIYDIFAETFTQARDYDIEFSTGEHLVVEAELYQASKPVKLLGRKVFTSQKENKLSILFKRTFTNTQKTQIKHSLNINMPGQELEISEFEIETKKHYPGMGYGLPKELELKAFRELHTNRPYKKYQYLYYYYPLDGKRDEVGKARFWIPDFDKTIIPAPYYIVVKAIAQSQLNYQSLDKPMLGYQALDGQIIESVDGSKFKATLPNGASVELVGVCEHPSEAKQWWRPDGGSLEDVPYDQFKYKVHPDRTQQAREMAIRLRGTDEISVDQASVTWKISGTRSRAGNVNKEGKQILHTRAVAFKCDSELEKIDVKVAVAAGSWQTVSSCPASQIALFADDLVEGGEFIWYAPAQQDGKAYVVVAMHEHQNDIRIVAVDKQGNIHEHGRMQSLGRDGRINMQRSYDLPLSQVKEFQFQTRPYEWVQFENVSLKPNFKTNVQIKVDSKSAKADSIVAAAPDAVASQQPIDEIIIEALIDDVSEIWLTSEGIYWKHITRYAKPGLHDGRNEPTLVNGKEWFPLWSMPDRERGIDTSKLYPMSIGALNFNAELLAVGKAINAKGIERGSIRLRREKNAVVVTADDRLPLAGSRWYRIRLYRSDDLRDITFTKQPYKQAVKEVTVSAIQKVSFAGNDIIQVKANAQAGFNFPFYLFVPKSIDKDKKVHLLVESNNTGTTSDDLEVHQEKALRSVSKNYPNRIARSLGSPLLVPVFPRPSTNWQAYTHALDRDTLEIEEGSLKRIDLQLTSMIKYAQQLLRINGFKIHDQIFMHGFSASAKFCNRYSFLHPEMVKAEASGGVNGLPTLPVSKWNDYELPFPIGIAGIEMFTGRAFNEKTFRKVAHYIYMGAFDRNDTLPSRDAWSEEEADIIKKALAEKMMPDRWELTKKIYKDQNINAQCITYNGIPHSIRNEMLEDVIKFFEANSGDKYVPIEPHQYPFVEYKQIRQAHVNGLYWCDDERLLEKDRKNPYERTFLIGIEEWNESQDHRQLEEFKTNAGFRFVLKAEGQKNIEINEKNFSGTRSWGNGEFQAFYVKLKDSQFGQIVPGVSYRLEALNDSNEYFWTVNDGVTLTKAQKEKIKKQLATLDDHRQRLLRDMRNAEESLQDVRERFKISDLDEHNYPHSITQRLIRLEKQKDDCRLEIAQQKIKLSMLGDSPDRRKEISEAQEYFLALNKKLEQLQEMVKEAQRNQSDLDMAKSLYKQRLDVLNERKRMLDSIKAKIEKLRLEYDGIGLSTSPSPSRTSRTRKPVPRGRSRSTKPDSEDEAYRRMFGEGER